MVDGILEPWDLTGESPFFRGPVCAGIHQHRAEAELKIHQGHTACIFWVPKPQVDSCPNRVYRMKYYLLLPSDLVSWTCCLNNPRKDYIAVANAPNDDIKTHGVIMICFAIATHATLWFKLNWVFVTLTKDKSLLVSVVKPSYASVHDSSTPHT